MTTTPTTGRRTRLLPIQFTALSLAWGSSFLFIKVGLRGLSPVQVVAGRMILGAVVLGALVLIRRTPLPRSASAWGHIVVVALFLCVLPFSLFAWAEQHVSSGLASIYNATTPLMTTVVTLLALREERPNRTQLVGLLLGLGGVLVVLAPWQGLDLAGSILAQLACLLATASYGIAFVYLRKFVSPLRLPTIAVAAAQVGVGAIVLAFCVPFLAWQPITLDPTVIASMLGLGIFGTGFAYVWNTNIVNGWGATAASTVTYLTPVVGVLLGAALLHEQVTWNQPGGAALVVGGILISKRA